MHQGRFHVVILNKITEQITDGYGRHCVAVETIIKIRRQVTT